MSHCVSNIIAIRTGGVFSGKTDMESLKKDIIEVVDNVEKEGHPQTISRDNLEGCLSRELQGGKGSYVVIAGVFNYWTSEQSSEFAKQLSEKYSRCEVIYVCWDEENDKTCFSIYLNGEDMANIGEDCVGKILRHVT